MRLQCGNSVTHPVFIFIIFPQLFKINLRILQYLPGNITVRPVHYLQKIFPAPVSGSHLKICQNTPAYPVPEKIRKLFFHSKRNLILHQRIDQSLCLLISPNQDRRIFNLLSTFQSFLQSCHYTHVFFSWILKFFARHRHPLFIGSGQLFLKTSGIAADHFHGCMQDIFTATVINIQKDTLRLRIILCKI